MQRGNGFYFYSALLDKTHNDLDGTILLSYLLQANGKPLKINTIMNDTGLSQGRLKRARKLLSALRFVDEEKIGHAIIYSILDPELLPSSSIENASKTEYETIQYTLEDGQEDDRKLYKSESLEGPEAGEICVQNDHKFGEICNYNYNNFSYYKYNKINSNVIGTSQLNTQSNSSVTTNSSLLHNYTYQKNQKSLVNFDGILNGELDQECKESVQSSGRWHPRGHLPILLDGWAKLFHPRYTEGLKLKLNHKRISAFQRTIDQGYLPSDFAKAIIGMSYDQWSERKSYCDWEHVARAMPRWLKLYEESLKPVIETKTIFVAKKRVIIPVDYTWEQSDTHMLENGYRLNLETRKWEK